MYNRSTENYQFTGIYYSQVLDGVPVFRSRLILLTRNEDGYPLVLASADLRNIGRFKIPTDGLISDEHAYLSAVGVVPKLDTFNETELVVWAGVNDMVVKPRLAVQFIAQAGSVMNPSTYQKWLFLIDAQTGDVLYQENQIQHVDFEGNVSGMATQGNGADICDIEDVEPLPHVLVNVGLSSFTFADENGVFVLPNNGTFPRNVKARLLGQYFRVINQAGPNTVLTQNEPPPGPVNFMFNESNSSEFERAEINAYVESHVVRNFILNANPEYPIISDQQFFPVNVNLNDTCNAFYNGFSINFFRAGGGCPNTANTTIVHHEYAHHLVSSGGSGQGAYGEGMGDVIAVLITDDPILAVGFFMDCNDGLRNADNDLQYPCSGEIHFCGQLLSGCVWDTRNELALTEPANYIEILGDLAVNSVLLHNGSNITPQIAVDWLTLDDNDGNIFNGTPHCPEIQTGFGAHNMEAPGVPCP